MTDDRKLKEAIRARQAQTGESYMEARRHVLSMLERETTPDATLGGTAERSEVGTADLFALDRALRDRAPMQKDPFSDTPSEEDLRYGLDATTLATVPEKAVATAEITPRASGVLCGDSVARAAFQRYLPEIEVLSEASDGDKAVPGEPALVLSGRTRGVLTYREGKIARLEAWLAEQGESLDGASFYSDSHNDLPLLQRVERPRAVNPDPQLRAHAEARGWPIISLR